MARPKKADVQAAAAAAAAAATAAAQQMIEQPQKLDGDDDADSSPTLLEFELDKFIGMRDSVSTRIFLFLTSFIHLHNHSSSVYATAPRAPASVMDELQIRINLPQ